MQTLDLRTLEIFRAVAVEGGVSKAATRLNRVQSNISTRIKQLEQHLGKDLFVRQNRGLTLTADGQLLLTYAERLLQLSQEASEAMNEGQPSGVFRMGTMESTAAARLPAILSKFHQLYPAVEVELETDTAGGLIRRLRTYDVDVIFAAEPISFDGIETRPVFAEELVLVAPETFPPLDDVSQVSGRTIVAFEPGCAYRRYLEDWLLHAGVVPGGILSMGSYLAILASVSAGTGFAVVPRCVLEAVSVKGRFRTYELPKSVARVTTLMAWRSDYASVKLDALAGLLPAFKGASETPP